MDRFEWNLLLIINDHRPSRPYHLFRLALQDFQESQDLHAAFKMIQLSSSHDCNILKRNNRNFMGFMMQTIKLLNVLGILVMCRFIELHFQSCFWKNKYSLNFRLFLHLKFKQKNDK